MEPELATGTSLSGNCPLSPSEACLSRLKARPTTTGTFSDLLNGDLRLAKAYFKPSIFFCNALFELTQSRVSSPFHGCKPLFRGSTVAIRIACWHCKIGTAVTAYQNPVNLVLIERIVLLFVWDLLVVLVDSICGLVTVASLVGIWTITSILSIEPYMTRKFDLCEAYSNEAYTREIRFGTRAGWLWFA